MRQTLRLVLLCLVGVFAAAFAEPGDQPKSLFNGKDLTGWKGDESVWSVKDGAITGHSSDDKPLKHNTFLIWQDGKVKDFELRCQFKIEGGNSGVQYRSAAHDDFVVSGYQADIVDGDPDKYSGILYEEKGRGILAERGQKVAIDKEGKKKVEKFADAADLAKAVKKNDWNEYVITAQGNSLIHKINGVTTMEMVDAQEGKSSAEGILALQVHMGPSMTVQFKEITLKELAPPAASH